MIPSLQIGFLLERHKWAFGTNGTCDSYLCFSGRVHYFKSEIMSTLNAKRQSVLWIVSTDYVPRSINKKKMALCASHYRKTGWTWKLDVLRNVGKALLTLGVEMTRQILVFTDRYKFVCTFRFDRFAFKIIMKKCTLENEVTSTISFCVWVCTKNK